MPLQDLATKLALSPYRLGFYRPSALSLNHFVFLLGVFFGVNHSLCPLPFSVVFLGPVCLLNNHPF